MRVVVATAISLSLLLAACAGAPSRTQLSTVVEPAATPVEPAATTSEPATAIEAATTIEPVAMRVRADLFGERIVLPDVEQMFALTAEQERDFLDYFSDPANGEHKPHKRIYRYLERRLAGFRYYGKTLTATEALAGGQGNCLSLALVTTALARLAGVELSYERARNAPVFERQRDFVVVGDHVRTRLYDPTFVPEPGYIVTQRPHTVIDYFPEHGRRSGGRVSMTELQAMYHVNLATEAMAQGDLHRSFWLLQAALERVADDPDALNSLAVLHRSVGAEDEAESIYRRALALHGDKLNLLVNLSNLLRGQSRWQEAEAIEARLSQFPDRNPYRLIEHGNEAFAAGRMRDAIEHYSSAVEIAPYLHEAYWRLAIVYDAKGWPGRAARFVTLAHDIAVRDRDRTLYQAKLHALTGKVDRGH